MDLQTLQARAQAAREVQHTETHARGDITYRLRVPTRHEVLLAWQRSGAAASQQRDTAALLVMQRALLEAAVVGWQGARVCHVLTTLADSDPEGQAPLAWAPGAVPLLLDAQPEHAQALGDLITHHMAQRAAALDADAKN